MKVKLALAAIWCLAAVAVVFGDEPKTQPSIRFSESAPAPAAQSSVGNLKLTPDVVFVIDSDVPCIVAASPLGVVAVTKEAGPVKIRGKFIDGGGKTETRTYKGKWVYTVEGLPTVNARVELLVIPEGAKEEADIIRKQISVESGDGPRPPPNPVDPPNPIDPDAKPPIPGDGLRVMIVYEATQLSKLPASQHSIIYGKTVRDYMDGKCPLEPDGKTHAWRIYDKDTDLSAELSVWQDAIKRPRKSVPWIVISNGKTGFEGPLPSTPDETLTLLKKYGG